MFYLRSSFLICLLLALQSAWAGEPLYFKGEISEQSVDAFISKYADSKAGTLYIDSGGGEVEAGIRLGLWLHNRDMNVIVDGVCLSSCANYVFTAGKKKTVLKGSVVGWHGNYHHLKSTGLWMDDVELRMSRDGEDRTTATAKVRAQLEKLVALEKDFFTTVGVSEYLCWVGKVDPFNVSDYYTLTAMDMGWFGVKNVSLPLGYWEQDFSVFDERIVYIRLPQH